MTKRIALAIAAASFVLQAGVACSSFEDATPSSEAGADGGADALAGDTGVDAAALSPTCTKPPAADELLQTGETGLRALAVGGDFAYWSTSNQLRKRALPPATSPAETIRADPSANNVDSIVVIGDRLVWHVGTTIESLPVATTGTSLTKITDIADGPGRALVGANADVLFSRGSGLFHCPVGTASCTLLPVTPDLQNIGNTFYTFAANYVSYLGPKGADANALFSCPYTGNECKTDLVPIATNQDGVAQIASDADAVYLLMASGEIRRVDRNRREVKLLAKIEGATSLAAGDAKALYVGGPKGLFAIAKTGDACTDVLQIDAAQLVVEQPVYVYFVRNGEIRRVAKR